MTEKKNIPIIEEEAVDYSAEEDFLNEQESEGTL